jgi:hypothetical protein
MVPPTEDQLREEGGRKGGRKEGRKSKIRMYCMLFAHLVAAVCGVVIASLGDGQKEAGRVNDFSLVCTHSLIKYVCMVLLSAHTVPYGTNNSCMVHTTIIVPSVL